MKIEDIVRKHRDNMDVEQPPAKLWDGIKEDWKKPATTIHWWKIAAIFFISTSLVLLVYTLSLQNQVDSLASLGDISSEYKKLERSYQQEIKMLEASISLEEVRQYEELSWLADEMDALEEINTIYRQDIGQVGEDEQLVNALIDYYEKKIRLLKKLELELKRTKTIKDDETTIRNTSSV